MADYEFDPGVLEAWSTVQPYLPMVLGALGIAVGGWLVAVIIRRVVFSALKRTSLDDRLAEALGFKQDGSHRLERNVANTAYYLVLALVCVALLDHLQLDTVTGPLLGALEGIGSAVPSLMKAVLIGGVGFLVAVVLRKAVVALLERTSLVERLQSLGQDPDADEDTRDPKQAASVVGSLVFWAILALTAIPLLEALKVGMLAAPLAAALETIATYLPRAVAAAGLMLVGYVLSRFARAVLRAAIDKLGLDDRLRSWGLAQLLDGRTAGTIVGNVAMAFIMLHFAISAIGRLGIEEIGKPLGLVLVHIYDYLPRAFVAALILVLGVFLARLIARMTGGLLAAVGFNSFAEQIGLYTETDASKAQASAGKKVLDAQAAGDSTQRAEAAQALATNTERLSTPADVAGAVLGGVVVLLFVQQALQTLKLQTLSEMVARLLEYSPNLIVAVIVLAAGIWIGTWLRGRIADVTTSSEDPLVRALGPIARGVAITIAAMVALQQLGVAAQLVAIAFGLILGAVCLALALAFGLGGREVAGAVLRKAYDRRNKK